MSTAQAMGLKPKQLTDYGLISIEIDGKERYLFYDGSNPNMQLSSWLSMNKHTARTIFAKNGLPNIPFCCPTDLAEAQRFLAEHKKIIAKPLKGQHSKDIVVLTEDQRLKDISLQSSLLEKYIAGKEMRYLVLHGEVIAAHYKSYKGEINNPETVKRIS